jgi:hypothetical protein
MRHLRSLAIAAVVLMISAAVVFAGGGPAWKTTAPAEAEASVAPSDSPSVAPSESPSESPVASPSESPSAAPDEASPSPEGAAGTQVEEESDHPDNHGKAVSEAAHNGPPEGDTTEYRNHGEYVSSVARDNHGHNKGTDQAATSKAKGGQPDDDESGD